MYKMDYHEYVERAIRLKTIFSDQCLIYSCYRVINHTKHEILYEVFDVNNPYSLENLNIKTSDFLSWDFTLDQIEAVLVTENVSQYIAIENLFMKYSIDPKSYGYPDYVAKINQLLLSV